jgi:hypothetical protein
MIQMVLYMVVPYYIRIVIAKDFNIGPRYKSVQLAWQTFNDRSELKVREFWSIRVGWYL